MFDRVLNTFLEFMTVLLCFYWGNAANKYYSSAGHHEQKIKKITTQITFFGGHNKITNKISLTKFSM